MGGRLRLEWVVAFDRNMQAGLVIAQPRAEGARRILLILPKPLLG
jgi:hypothetical protein